VFNHLSDLSQSGWLPCTCHAQVVEAQLQLRRCLAAARRQLLDLLWSVAVTGSLGLDLWDALAVALDQPGIGLQAQQLQQVFEAHCLVVLRIGGPAPGQLLQGSWQVLPRPSGLGWSCLQPPPGCSCCMA